VEECLFVVTDLCRPVCGLIFYGMTFNSLKA